MLRFLVSKCVALGMAEQMGTEQRKEVIYRLSKVVLPVLAGWLSWLGSVPYTKRSQVQSLVRACMGDNRLIFLSLSLSLSLKAMKHVLG